MKIGIVINTSWNIYNFRKGLVEALVSDGHQVFAIAPKDEYSEKIPSLGAKYVEVEMDNKGTNPIKDYLLINRLKKIYETLDLDIALHYTIKPNIYGCIATRNLKTKAINNVSGLGTAFIRQNIVSKVAKNLYKLSCKEAYHVFFQNNDDRKFFVRTQLVKRGKTSLLPGSGINTSQISFNPKNYSELPFKFLLSSRMLVDKGVGEFMKAARKLKDKYKDKIEFHVCGKPEEKESLGFNVDKINNWVEDGLINYLGHIDNVIEEMVRVDCVVLPSYREGTPRVLLEAAAVGRPIITTDAPGCREVVSDKINGLLCKVKDVESLYSNMEKIFLTSPEKKQEMARRGRQIVENKFDESIVIEQYRKILN